MKKNLILSLIITVLCAALIIGITGCDTEDNPSDDPRNMLTEVFEGNEDFGLVNRFVTGGAGWTDEMIEGYTINDLFGDELAFSNYSSFCFKWKSNKYRVTKVEFDIVTQTELKSKFEICNPKNVKEIAVDMGAGETKHLSFDCDIKRETGLFFIFNDVTDKVGTTKGEISWKLTNLYVTAEKI